MNVLIVASSYSWVYATWLAQNLTISSIHQWSSSHENFTMDHHLLYPSSSVSSCSVSIIFSNGTPSFMFDIHRSCLTSIVHAWHLHLLYWHLSFMFGIVHLLNHSYPLSFIRVPTIAIVPVRHHVIVRGPCGFRASSRAWVGFPLP